MARQGVKMRQETLRKKSWGYAWYVLPLYRTRSLAKCKQIENTKSWIHALSLIYTNNLTLLRRVIVVTMLIVVDQRYIILWPDGQDLASVRQHYFPIKALVKSKQDPSITLAVVKYMYTFKELPKTSRYKHYASK